MRLEETVILPVAQRVLNDADWEELDAAFARNCDPLTGKYPRDPAYDRLFTRIVMRAPAPIGLGEG
ncbi:MAG: hemerythrin domain-containing protein, partial [Aquabacterium sp.]|nr:hemerythrin domain-containing protein [Aquabacterium sp.]